MERRSGTREWTEWTKWIHSRHPLASAAPVHFVDSVYLGHSVHFPARQALVAPGLTLIRLSATGYSREALLREPSYHGSDHCAGTGVFYAFDGSR